MATSKQLNFYFSNLDQEELTMKLDDHGGVLAARPPFSGAVISGGLVATFSRWNPGEHYVILFRPEEADDIVLRHISPERGYSVDITRSPVIEFSRCVQTNDELLRGRFYCATSYEDDVGAKIEKPAEFIRWTNEIFGIAKKLCKIRRDGICIGRDAASLERLGYRLVPP